MKRSQSIISLQIKTKNQKLEKLSTNDVALIKYYKCENIEPKLKGVISQNIKKQWSFAKYSSFWTWSLCPEGINPISIYEPSY